MKVFNVLLEKAILLFNGMAFSLAIVIVLWGAFFIIGLVITITNMFNFSPKSVDESKIINQSHINRYSIIRAISIVMFLAEFVFAALVGKVEFKIEYYKDALVVTGVLFVVIVLLYLSYKSIVKPLLTETETNEELKKQEDKILDYKHDVNEYRKSMNLIFTLAVLLLLLLFVFYSSIPDFVKPEDFGKFKEILSYFSIPAFGASIVLIFNTEQKLENIYWTYFPDEYKEYINKYFSKKQS